MKLCPRCQAVYADTEVFCWKDGNLLIDKILKPEINPNPIPTIPHFDGILPPDGNIPPPTVQIGQPNFPPLNETVTVIHPTFTPPIQAPPAAASSNKNIIIAVLATASVFLLIGMIFLIVNNRIISKETEVGTSSNPERESNNNSNKSNSENNNSKNEKQENADDKDNNSNKSTPEKNPYDINRSLPNGREKQFSGASSFPDKKLPLTLLLTRDGKNLSGSAETPNDWDNLSGIIQPDGSFTLQGYNPNAGRVTGIWRGRISESGQISGVWTSTENGSRVRFYAGR